MVKGIFKKENTETFTCLSVFFVNDISILREDLLFFKRVEILVQHKSLSEDSAKNLVFWVMFDIIFFIIILITIDDEKD